MLGVQLAMSHGADDVCLAEPDYVEVNMPRINCW